MSFYIVLSFLAFLDICFRGSLVEILLYFVGKSIENLVVGPGFLFGFYKHNVPIRV
jgi:hypothetical protein